MEENEIQQQNVENKLSYPCPSCGAMCTYVEGQTSVHCESCGTFFNPIEDQKRKDEEKERKRKLEEAKLARASQNNNVDVAALNINIEGVKNAESGINFARAIYDGMDWEEFQLNTYEYRISKIVDLLNEIKITCSSNKLTWLMEFESYVVPYTKKIEGLEKHVKELVDAISAGNETDASSAFSTLNDISICIYIDKDEILPLLEKDIENYKKFGASNEEVKEIEDKFDEFKELIEKVTFYDNYEDIPGISKFYEEKDSKIASELMQEGILAEQEYQRAIDLYKGGKTNLALSILIKLKGYKDANTIINKENDHFEFDDYLRFDGKPYYCKTVEFYRDIVGADKQVTHQKQDEAQNIYEIVGKKPAEEPIVKNIKRILVQFGTRILYYNKELEIRMYDFTDKRDIVIDDKKTFDTSFSTIYIDKYNSTFSYKRKIPSQIKNSSDGSRNNEFEMIEVRMTDNTPLAEHLFFFNKIEYQVGKMIGYSHTITIEKDGGKKAIKENKKVRNDYDFELRTTRRFLDAKAHITFADGNYLYYLRYAPTPYNLNLYRFDLTKEDDQEEECILKNIFDVKIIEDNKVFYVVGKDTMNAFYVYDIDKKTNVQLLTNTDDEPTRSGGYIFIVRYNGKDKVLYKIKEDGSKYFILTKNFQATRGIKNGMLYYMNNDDSLIKVRLDGTDEQVLLENYKDGNIMRISNDRIYCSLRETVDYKDNQSVAGYSIISFNSSGNQLQKHIFNILNGRFLDEKIIIYSKIFKRKFKITNPDKNMDPIVYKDIIEYYRQDIETGISELEFTTGQPHGMSEPRGCFKKKSVPFNYVLIDEDNELDNNIQK